MDTDQMNYDVYARYELCKKCLEENYTPGGSHCLSVIARRLDQADKGDKWLNPYYVEKHAQLEQPLTDQICPHCKFKEEHEMREFVSNL